MSDQPSPFFEIPHELDRYLATLSKLYAQEGERLLQEIIVNAKVRIHEAWNSDNWNGGTYGHALYLTVPESLFLSAVKQRTSVQDQIKKDLNHIHNVQNEYIADVFLELEVIENSDWRQQSGALVTGARLVPPDATKRIWGDRGFRLFLSHKSEVKKGTASLKESLSLFGISAFVAHQDISPTKAWQEEIENALASMDGFVALMTEDFHDSDWTDQEVGCAIARGVPIIAVKLGKDPYGFIGKFQALSSHWLIAAEDIAKILIKNDRMVNAYIQALRSCQSFDDGNKLSKLLPEIERLSTEQIDELILAYNENSQINGSHGFSGLGQGKFGPGLVSYLNRFSSKKFRFTDTWLIEAIS